MLREIVAIIIGIGAALGAYAYGHYEGQHQERRQQRRHREPHNGSDPGTCVICNENPYDVLFLPCGHVCVCQSCQKALFQKVGRICPMCREPIDEVRKTYCA